MEEEFKEEAEGKEEAVQEVAVKEEAVREEAVKEEVVDYTPDAAELARLQERDFEKWASEHHDKGAALVPLET